MKYMPLIFKDKKSIHQSRHVKILIGNVTHLMDLEIMKMLEREPRCHIPFWSMIYLLMKLKIISETDNGIEFEFQYQKNHGPEWNAKLSIPIGAPYMHFCVLKMSNSTKQNLLN